jgi:hypothetical protein
LTILTFSHHVHTTQNTRRHIQNFESFISNDLKGPTYCVFVRRFCSTSYTHTSALFKGFNEWINIRFYYLVLHHCKSRRFLKPFHTLQICSNWQVYRTSSTDIIRVNLIIFLIFVREQKRRFSRHTLQICIVFVRTDLFVEQNRRTNTQSVGPFRLIFKIVPSLPNHISTPH